jgi:hypothetical protein
VTALVIVLCLITISVVILLGGYKRYRQYKSKFERTAAVVCDSGSWRVRLCGRTMLCEGRFDGHRICYSVSGDERRRELLNSYLLLEWPVKMNFRYYRTSDPDLVDRRMGESLSCLQQTAEFRGLVVTSRDTPFLASLLSRPLGFGYKPGLLLWKYEAVVLDEDIMRSDIHTLIGLAEQGI